MFIHKRCPVACDFWDEGSEREPPIDGGPGVAGLGWARGMLPSQARRVTCAKLVMTWLRAHTHCAAPRHGLSDDPLERSAELSVTEPYVVVGGKSYNHTAALDFKA